MRSILYVKEMFDACAIAQIKTETRRTHGLDTINKDPNRYFIWSQQKSSDDRWLIAFYDTIADKQGMLAMTLIKSRYKKGEILYLAEPMWIINNDKVRQRLTALDVPHLYHWDMKESQLDAAEKLKEEKLWNKISPLLMKQEYGRHFIQIIDIKCERVQEISEESVINEGVLPLQTGPNPTTVKTMYASLFDKVNGPGAWDKNPFVFVYQFKYLPNFKRRLQ